MIKQKKWTKDSIFKSINNFIAENNRLPRIRELDHQEDLPSANIIKHRFNIESILYFYQEHYNNYIDKQQIKNKYNVDMDYWLKDFKAQYISMNQPSMKKYDKNRKDGTPSVKYLIRICGVGSWTELLSRCGFRVFLKKQDGTITINRPKQQFVVSVKHAFSTMEETQKILNCLDSIII